MTTAEYWETVEKLPQREVTHVSQRGRLVVTTVVNWAPIKAPNTAVPDQYDYVLGWNPVDERWEQKPKAGG